MKNIIKFLTLVLVVVFASCESKEFFFFPTFSGSFGFELHREVSSIYLEKQVSFPEVNDSLLDALEGGLLEDIDIEGFYFNCTALEENQLDSAALNLYVRDQEGNNLLMIEDLLIDVATLEPNVNYPLYDYLNKEGILELKSLFFELQENPEKQILFLLKGEVSPANAYAAMEMEVHFKINMKISTSGFK